MPYIGRGISQLQTIDKLDAITPSTSTGAGPYNLTQSSSAFTPISANNLLISINGVVQYGNFTVSGSTVTFTGALSDSDTCNFILHVGEGIVNTPGAGTVSTSTIAADAVTGAKIADDAIDSEHYTDGSIDTAHIADSQVTTAKIAADAVTDAKIADDAINSEHYTDGSIDTAHIADLNVTQAKIANEAINEAKLQVSNTPTNGYFLSAQSGNTGGLTWAEAGGGDVVKLNETSHSSDVASISIDGHHTSDYDIYDYIIDDFSVSADSNAIRVRVNMGGSAQTGSAYRNAGWDAYRSSSGHSLGASGDWNQSYFRPNGNWGSPKDTSYDRGYLHVRLINPLSTTIYKYGYYWNTYQNHDDSQQVAHSGGWRYQTSQGTAVSGLTFYLSSSGNFKSYRVRLYGVK